MHRPTPKQPPPVETSFFTISEVKIEEERKEEKKDRISTEIIVTPRSSDMQKKSTF